MLSPRAIAMQGVGSVVLAFALQGLVGVEESVGAGGGGGAWGARAAAPAGAPRGASRARIRATNLMLLAAALAIAQGEHDGDIA